MVVKKCVKYYDFLDLTKAVLESIGVTASLGAITNLDFAEWVVKLFRKTYDVLFQLVFLDWIEF